MTRTEFLILMSAALAALAAPAVAQSPVPERGDEIIYGCGEGEGCGCSGEKRTSKSFRLYEDMSASSPLLGAYKGSVAAQPGASFSLVKEPGSYRVTAVHKPLAGLKVGDVVDRLFSHGEGVMQVRFNGKRIIFEDEIELEPIVPTRIETWYQVSVGARHGYSRTFPFRTCHEGPAH